MDIEGGGEVLVSATREKLASCATWQNSINSNLAEVAEPGTNGREVSEEFFNAIAASKSRDAVAAAFRPWHFACRRGRGEVALAIFSPRSTTVFDASADQLMEADGHR